ncbi:MAG: type III pantothenate kinase [Chloroflexi bacterium]|nr:type III pantothenate kinase [Chloroflexota bacterium]
MLLTVDIGNTNIVLGLYDGTQLRDSWRAATDPRRTADEYAVTIYEFLARRGYRIEQIADCAVSSVVPALTPVFRDLAKRYWEIDPLIVSVDIDLGLRVLTDNPREVGADRIVNAVAAKALYGAPAIVIDFGTATTWDVVNADGDYIGGAIAPGVGISAEALASRAARLHRIELTFPPTAIGKSTDAAMRVGILYGYVGIVEGLTERIRRELGGNVRVIATGGLAGLIAAQTPVIERVDPDLTLLGLRLLWERNRNK